MKPRGHFPPANFTVQLHSGRRGFKKPEVESLISACSPPPERRYVFPSGPVAGRLFYRQWCEALEAVVFFWERRLSGVHTLTPEVFSDHLLQSDRKELSDRLKSLFSERVREVLDGESVRNCKKKIGTISAEIAKISGFLNRPRKWGVVEEYQAKRKGLSTEKELLTRKLEEFRAAMDSILARLGEAPREECPDGQVDVFKFGDELDWVELQQIIVREGRRLDEGLPIYAYRREILRQIHLQQVVVLIGETGSGKSTQLVQFISDSGLAANGSIVCTQPRKIAATSLARRVREESYACYPDNAVVCYPSFSSAQKFDSNVVFTTDHCLLQHCMSDGRLAGISFIIIDEAHERSLNTDLLLALLKKLLLQRFELRLVIMSATADAAKLADYFFGCITLHVTGRSFPVDIQYVPNASGESSWASTSKCYSTSCASYVLDAIKVVSMINEKEEDGAILAFLTSQAEVEWACENFQSLSAVVLPLHGKLSGEEQGRVFQNYPGKRKVIFSTNLAETSLTIPGVRYVVDSGMVKENRFEPGTGMNVLRVCKISQSSANQRSGRAGRTGPGKCYRLYSQLDLQAMACHQEPEIRRVHLGIAILRLLALGIKNVEDFDFVDAPDMKAVEMANSNLIQLGAMIYKNDLLELTDVGRQLVKLGIEPRLGKLIMESFNHKLGREGLVLAAVMANASSIFCRVGNEEEKSKSDCLKVQFCHEDGDLFTLLSVYRKWEHENPGSRNLWCWKNSINAKSMRRCKETVSELEHCLKQELRIIIPSYWKWDPDKATPYDKLLKKVILSSLVENVAMFSGYERLGYEVALTGQHVRLHPSCSLLIYGRKPSWVVFSELLQMSNQYLVCVTAFDYDSLLEVEPPPHFDVSAMEGRKMQRAVITGLGNYLLRRLCGKLNNSLHRLISHIQTACADYRIGLDVNFDKGEIEFFASLVDMKKVSTLINAAIECEAKWLRDECMEKCLFCGGHGLSPSVGLFGAGAQIKHLELEKRCLSVEVYHPSVHTLDDKELLMMFDTGAPGIANFYKYASIVQEQDSQKWGKITFSTPEAAEKAVTKLNGTKFCGSLLKVIPLKSSFVGEDKAFQFPPVKAKIFWPRRPSKGVAIVKCEMEDLGPIVYDCSGLVIGGRLVHCQISRNADCVIINRLSHDTTELEIVDALRHATKRRILDVFLLRGEPVDQPPVQSCTEALLKEIATFMPSESGSTNSCRVQVFCPEPKHFVMKAMLTFNGTLHLEAAKALQHIQGKVLTGFLPWQTIKCQQMFYSFVSCPAAVYFVIKSQLDALLESFSCREGVSCNLEKMDNGSFRVKLSANGTKTVVDMRRPFEQLMKGKTIAHPDLTPSVMHLLFAREGVSLMKTLEKETQTYILHDKQNLNIKIFGCPQHVTIAEEKLIQSLLHLHESKPVEIRLRGRDLPVNLLKEVIQKFGPDLSGLKEMVPEVELILNTRCHVLSVRGAEKLKKRVEEIVFEMMQSLSNGPSVLSNGEAMCSICLCEVEECYRLEACRHRFCRLCLVDQCESAIRNRDGFPLCCTFTGCRSEILLVDLKSLLPYDKLEDLFRASLAAFVASSSGAYRFCPSPDCPAVYEALDPYSSEEQPPFSCGACFVETCRKCHLEYHPSISCEIYKHFKEDPDSSLNEWRKGKDHVKSCPVCGYTIEKTEGCNHVECKCGAHICWVCLVHFSTSDECYGHLRSVHLAIM